jgi:hypothetical protein
MYFNSREFFNCLVAGKIHSRANNPNWFRARCDILIGIASGGVSGFAPARRFLE